MDDARIEAITAFALSKAILAELTVRLGPDFASAVEARMNAEVDRRSDNGNAYDQADAEAMIEGMDWIGWDAIMEAAAPSAQAGRP